MEKAKEFILKFLDKEAECWTNLELTDLDTFNNSVKELYEMAIEDLDESLGILQRSELDKEDNPKTYKPRHLYKLSAYKNEIYGNIWVAYVSSTTTDSDPKSGTIFEAFIIGEIENNLKVIATMIRYKNRSTMKVEGWKASVYNPSDLDIKKLGEFVSTERYSEPGDRDNFSLEEYLKDK
jgi:hypothetical protein